MSHPDPINACPVHGVSPNEENAPCSCPEGNVSHEEVSPSAATAPGTGLAPEVAPLDDEVRTLMFEVGRVSVSDLLDLASRYYRRLLDQNPEDVVHAAGYAYMAERSSALAALFRDSSDPERCALDGVASGVDFIRGLRVLALRHPVPEGRELHASWANCCCIVLSERIGGIPVDMEPTLETPGGSRATLRIWYQLVLRASRAAHEIAQSRGAVKSSGGIAMIGKAAQVRARLIVEFQTQGFGELGVLIDHVGLTLEDAAEEVA